MQLYFQILQENNAVKIGERIRSSIQNTYFKRAKENQPDKNITISIGVSSYPKSYKHQLINTADDALYIGKII